MRSLCFSISLAVLAVTSVPAATRIYFIGNSVTDAVQYSTWEATAEAAGQNIEWGRQMIPGAPIGWIWEHPNDGFCEPSCYPTALTNYVWDFVSLQPYDWLLPDDRRDGGSFMNYTKPKSPNVTFLIFGHYPRTSNIDKAGSYQAFWDRQYTGGWDGTNETRDYYEQLVRVLRSDHPDMRPVLLVPVGDVYYELDKIMRAGQFPGKTDIVSAAYADGIHQNSFGNYIVGCTYYSVIFKKNPTDFSGSRYGVPDNQASIIQQTVWRCVSTNPLSGVATTGAAQPYAGSRVIHRSFTDVATYSVTGRRSPTNGHSEHVGVFVTIGGDGTMRRVVSIWEPK